jgi:cytochrome c nitrite reductase small subunit
MRQLPVVAVVALAALVGMLGGLGGYTFLYARGYSYLLDDPAACVNCHVMRDQYNSWSVSSHRDVTCNGCHTPHQLIPKYLVKAENGFAHSYAFTFEDTQVIHIKAHSRRVVEHNCVECHETTVSTIFHPEGEDTPRCTVCHPNVGHAP